ncbi:20629_t:CDS:2 [Gigaspora margarita]|uniref:20629_t:CDS:1 n=1 Tax=Gigaspora margarita TaxID=4874 RepID=A0ABM8W1L7_GIGMA|nr:20629_t:CDS:2 [Gigaspora margarita]
MFRKLITDDVIDEPNDVKNLLLFDDVLQIIDHAIAIDENLNLKRKFSNSKKFKEIQVTQEKIPITKFIQHLTQMMY